MMAKVSFEMSDVQHKELFIATLVLYIRIPLMQQNIATWTGDLEISMKLEASPFKEIGVGMNHFQSQLENITIKLQDIKKGKEFHE